MELYKELLARMLEKEKVIVAFPDLQLNATEIINLQSYKTLQKIKTTIEDDSLSDFECIEKIVQIFEEIGSGGGIRHDF